MAAEIELKLAVAAEHLPRLARLPLLKSAARARATHLFSVYYDTPDLELRDQGVALRLRRDRSRWVQTLKTAGRVDAGLHQRDELETPVPAQIISFPALAQSGAAPILTDPGLPLKLRPVFTTDFWRSVRLIEPEPGSQIELCIDRGTITAGGAQAPIHEIELELKAGTAERIVDLALGVLEHVPVRLEPATKAERGYALAKAGAAMPVKASTPALTAAMSVSDAFREVVFGCIAHLQANERGVLDSDDPEYLHQARVALRRLRSSLTVFRSAFPQILFSELVPELRWLGTQLGPARDWDVFATESLPAVSTAFPGDEGLHRLTEQVAQMRAAADDAARESLLAPRYTRLLLELIRWFLRQPWNTLPDPAAAAERERPLREFAAAVLERRHQKILKRKRNPSHLDAAGLHQLRIQAKKLRYAAEFFAGLYERKAVRDYVAAMARVQDCLGALNDAVTAERLLETLRGDGGPDLSHEAIGLMRGWVAAGTRAGLEKLPEDWKRLHTVEAFWSA